MTRGPRDDATQPAARVARRRSLGRRRQRLRWTTAVLAAVAVISGAAALTLWWFGRPSTYRPGEAMPEITRRLARDLPERAPRPRFADVTRSAGLASFVTFAGQRTSQLPEDMGPGAAWGDFDNDGDDDLLLVSAGGPLDTPGSWAPCALFENLGDGTFAPVDRFPDLRLVGMGAAWGDCDGDGWLDLVITGYRRLILLRNRQGTLVPDDAFTAPDGFWAGVSWGDYDNDRDLDLYVCGYVRYLEDDADRARASTQSGRSVPYTLNPSSYEPQPNLLLRNDGAGAFIDVAAELGVANPQGRSLGAVWHDFDDDGWLDLYVANDVSDNVLYRNRGGTFEDVSHAAWVADYRGAMGLAVGDHDRDGDDDIFVTHWVAQENALYESQVADVGRRPAEPTRKGSTLPGLRFMDAASMLGVGQIALSRIGWGAEFADFDGDGWLDLVVTNGSTFEATDDRSRLRPQPPFLFWNRDGDAYHDLAPFCEPLAAAHVGRGLAVCDYDADGDQDVLLVHHAEPVQLLRNDMQAAHWLEVRLRSLDREGRHTGRGDGATVLATVDGVTLRRSVTGASYLSQSSRTLHFGLGDAVLVDRLEVRWLGGAADVHEGLEADALWELREGDPTATRVRGAPAAPRATTGGPGPDARERILAFWAAQRAAMQAMRVDGDCDLAIDHFAEALRLDPDHGDSRYYLANCLAALGRTDEAFDELERLLEREPRSHRALKRLGVLRASTARSTDDLRLALDLLERAMAVNPEETGVPLAIGEVALMLNDAEAARRRLEDVCRTNPRAVGAWFLRGYLAWKEGDEPRARAMLATAAESRGEDWKPRGATAEGDVAKTMHTDESPLSTFGEQWDGTLDPEEAFAELEERLRSVARD